jgi:hypothetical protein
MEIKPRLVVDVNSNKTKKGIKVQFVLPNQVQGDEKTTITQKLQNKVNEGLAKYNLSVSIDTDVPFSNTIGYLIPLDSIRILIKNALQPNQDQESDKNN